jgi:hypothetical protein
MLSMIAFQRRELTASSGWAPGGLDFLSFRLPIRHRSDLTNMYIATNVSPSGSVEPAICRSLHCNGFPKSLVMSFHMGFPRLLRLEITGDASTNGSICLGVSITDLAVT